MLKSLEKLRKEYVVMPASLASLDDCDKDRSNSMADKIQAEVDERYFRKDFGVNIAELVQNFAEHGCSAHEIERLGNILAEYGSLDAYIDKYYLPLPLFEDGEPLREGDTVYEPGVEDELLPIEFGAEYVTYSLDSSFVRVGDGASWTDIQRGEHLKRPPEPDTQEKIDTDFKKLKSDAEANVLTGGVFGAYEVKDLLEDFNAILARQRKLDGVE